MRTVESEGDLEYAWQVAHTEAAAAFSSGHLYLEKEIVNPRHVEVQVMGDQHGKVLHVGERECSIQRRHQKLIEESPSPAVDPELRARMMQAAVKGAAAASYYGAGTVEFLLSDTNEFYFLEMNTRIQVEHPVTEMVTGLDLIKQQVQVAAGEKLPLEQEDVVFEGHAIECRINAEDPAHDFRPSPGKITAFHVPGGPGVRVDTHAYTGYLIPSQYDSLLAKLIVYGPTREDAVARMLRALAEFVLAGVPTPLPFHREAIAHPDFKAGTFSTEFVQNLNS